MAKTESTAVNELISLVNENQGMKRMSDPADDLFGPPKQKVNPARMTPTIPPMRGAGEVAPLPRTRAAGGTSQLKLPDVPPPNVRMHTAPPTRGLTIPPIPQQKASGPIPPAVPTTKSSSPGLPSPVRNTASAPVISPPRVPALHPTHARPDSKPVLPMPKGTRPPASAPIAAPFEPTPTNAAANPFVAMPLGYPVVQRAPQVARIDMTGDAVSAENWFEHSRTVEKFEEETYVGTSPIKRQERAQTATLVKKMIAPTIALVIVGIMIGGFIAFNGEGGKKHVAKQPAVAQAEPVRKAVTPATAPTPSPESANAATATAGGEQPEPPVKTEPAAAKVDEPAAKADEPAAKADEPAAKAEPAPIAKPVAKPEPVAVAKAEPVAVAKAEPVAVAKAAAAVREVQTTRGVVKLADVRIDSKPSGATVMLVDNGKTSFLGTTPLATSLDPSRAYDVIFTIQGKPTQMAHFDPAKTPHLEMVLGKTATTVAPAPAPAVAKTTPAPAPAPAVAHHHHTAAPPAATKASAPPPTGTLADPGFDTPAPAPAKKVETPKVEKVEKPAKTEAPAAKAEPAVKAPSGATGTLMVSSKPPCEILIDGKSTGLTTPQRAIPLSPGAHKITFVNTAQNINKSVAVSISADQTTKLVKDLIAQ